MPRDELCRETVAVDAVRPADSTAGALNDDQIKQVQALCHAECWEETLALARPLLDQWPTHALLWSALVAAYRGLGETDAALAAARRVVDSIPQNAAAHANLGLILQQAGRLSEAEAEYRQAIMLRSDYAEAHENLGGLFQQMGRLAEAETAYRQALTHRPDAHAAWLNYGTLLQLRGALPAAVEAFRRTLAIRLRQLSCPRPAPPRPSFARAEIEALLWQTLAHLARAGVHAFATAGTLLGLVREGGLLAHDKDLDLGLPYDELGRAHACLLGHGWKPDAMNRCFLTPQAYWHERLGVTLDLLGLAVEPGSGMLLSGFWLKEAPWIWQRVTAFPGPLRLHKIEHAMGALWTLEDPERLLETIYGPEWRIPDPDFDTVIAACNLRGFSLLTQCYAFSRIYDRWQRGQLRQALASTRHSRRHLPEDVLLAQVEAHLAAALLASDDAG